ncbi:tyrosine-protein phosphatase [Glutamicibacter sp. V16R2B1]|uniref:tyrosine-protein phosphatase n=1 Tax=Glutamicibacter sp. V16R2B1 TaxID=2036207 RepID=UPI0020175DC6|nr:tyrosine-protein phosphatase [Glutamicibacter sp. V16R2B1]
MMEPGTYRRGAGDVTWDGSVNARRIAGSVYRMGRREWLTEAGWRQLRESGVRRVLDLRNPGENKARALDPRVRPDALEGIRVVNLPLEDAGNERFAAVAVPYMNHPSMYRLVCEEFPHRLREVFTELAAGEGGVVLHCSAGRDRTGLVASLLLALAGRGDEVLEQDALATRGINEWHRVSGYRHPHESHLPDGKLAPILASRAAALKEFMRWVGDPQEFLLRLGLSEATVQRLRQVVSQAQADSRPGR